MLRQITKLEGCRVFAAEGSMGQVEEIYFDDEHWVVRYLIVATGPWLLGRDVLIAPQAVNQLDLTARAVSLNLTREKVRRSPDISTELPVSRQHEADYFRYYGYPGYWLDMRASVANPIAPIFTPIAPLTAADRAELEEYRRRHSDSRPQDSHLRSSSEVTGYRIDATDGRVGHVADFLFDDETWALRYIVVDTRNWLPGRRVLISTQSIRAVNWEVGAVAVAATREQIEAAREFDPENLPPGDYEAALRQSNSA